MPNTIDHAVLAARGDRVTLTTDAHETLHSAIRRRMRLMGKRSRSLVWALYNCMLRGGAIDRMRDGWHAEECVDHLLRHGDYAQRWTLGDARPVATSRATSVRRRSA